MESNNSLRKEKEELSAIIDSIKNKLKEYSTKVQSTTAAEEVDSPEETAEDSIITQLRGLKNNVIHKKQLVKNLEKNKLKDTTEIARLNDELAAAEKIIDELNINYEDLNNTVEDYENYLKTIFEYYKNHHKTTTEHLENKIKNLEAQVNSLKTSVLRKPNNKYNITPPNSNVSWKFKKMAGVSYFHTARTHCTNKKELQNQLKIVRCILELKGFSKNQVKCMELHKKKDKPHQRKKFISTIKYNECSNRHVHIKNFVRNIPINLEKYYMPMDIPDSKLEQFVFTIKKMRKKLKF